MAEDEACRRAKKRVKDVRGFYSHLFLTDGQVPVVVL